MSTVFCIQFILLAFIWDYTLRNEAFVIGMPPDVATLGARFVCSLLMHLQVEGDVRNGLKTMKFSTNHYDEFVNPFFAFLLGFMQFFGGVFCEIFCIVYISSLNNAVDVIIRLIALGAVAKVDDFYASALPKENRMKHGGKSLAIKKRRGHIVKSERPLRIRFIRAIYKFLRVVYVSCIFYFLPFISIMLPYIAESN